MENVWSELKKIEAEAELIRSDAKEKSKQILEVSVEESKKLIDNSKTYANEEAQELRVEKIEEAYKKRDSQLKANEEAIRKLEEAAKNRMDKAALVVFDAVLGKQRLESDKTIL
jgi:vacuolar-type H+-ATPase subunit H